MDSILKRFNENRNGEDIKVIDRIDIGEKFNRENDFKLDYKERDYSSQFFNLYQTRLKATRERLREECFQKWNNGFKLNGKTVVEKQKVLDIQGNQPCWCVGTIYCEMKYKPNILNEVISDVYGAPDLVKSYTDSEGSDEIMLEDESGRVLLVGDFITSTPFVTGAIVGLLGMEAEAGTFQVLDICYPPALPQRPLPAPATLKGKKIALVSGINISINNPEPLLRLQLLQEYLMGRIVDSEKISEIGKLIICGGSIDSKIENNDSGNLRECINEFGKFLGNMLQSLPIALMPSLNDPSDQSLPQQPFHKALFDMSLAHYFNEDNKQILSLTTNPSNFDFNGVDALVISGDNINDICKYMIPYQESETDSQENKFDKLDTIEHRLDLMECTMKWQNIVPTSPDTLWSYPYKESDPFNLTQWPHVYIVGNQPLYGAKDVQIKDKTIKIISVPQYSETGSVVILDLETFNTEEIKIQI
ncbi:hypothetical protein Kpol_538p28 [Vanderwaltozyma polyspora DSM 70294]|uniref:DNA-directed DNA polymerase n=1 Tax=Vanderwaltozyma polyspora (strain ATCC 22028 / DSM 70294 / BCRC 21397 / CBS 2163 / NBRC 10782 / NRRL Y-8283 / UCD 57-17) TaxID=436907 RepID=A7TKE1_VANPO|nr:uncharacterized protein Kpol_538p28 [Vanderwaltozyma polyspora DSM 70294]EDO17268.1 hypothetical protein Kpol_538p28 [Vanderwaltozyma polyspora DSM 70294]